MPQIIDDFDVDVMGESRCENVLGFYAVSSDGAGSEFAGTLLPSSA